MNENENENENDYNCRYEIISKLKNLIILNDIHINDNERLKAMEYIQNKEKNNNTENESEINA